MENQQSSQSHPLNNSDNGGTPHSARHKTLVAKAKQKFSPGIKIGLLLALAVYFTLVVIGALGIKKCPLQDNIPLFLIATGAIGLVSKSISYIRERLSPHLDVKYIETSLYSVEVVFFILGAYWVYKVYPPEYEPEKGPQYCNKVVYMFAFVYITVVCTILVAILSGFLFFLVCICFLMKTGEGPDDNIDTEAQTNTEASEHRQPTV